ncbi:MAG: nucleoside-diphosphate kinase [Candidatus Muirbacterium halophilum]|nr:nucleoside-diphosphate kinase [Candidatus Muirbacterium halophilum]MCK9474728.1 nucleoside-diphosphate kinase [Candidatus Muirbacterium halophilum]
MAEKTLVIIKPDAVYRGFSGKIINRFEEVGFSIAAMKFQKVSEKQAVEHYKEHEGRDYYKRLMNFLLSGPVIVMVLEGPDVITRIRKMTGKTIATERESGTVRGDYSVNNLYNLIHSSDSSESSAREISIFFKPEEILEYETATKKYWFF